MNQHPCKGHACKASALHPAPFLAHTTLCPLLTHTHLFPICVTCKHTFPPTLVETKHPVPCLRKDKLDQTGFVGGPLGFMGIHRLYLIHQDSPFAFNKLYLGTCLHRNSV